MFSPLVLNHSEKRGGVYSKFAWFIFIAATALTVGEPSPQRFLFSIRHLRLGVFYYFDFLALSEYLQQFLEVPLPHFCFKPL